MTSKGKRLTYLTIALGVLVLAIAGYASRDLAVEQWYIWKLESEDEQERKLAAEKLGEMGSVRAVPSLMLQIERLEAKYSTIFGYARSVPPRNFQQSRAFHRAIHESLWKRYKDQEWEKNWAGKALAKIGTAAIPAMIASLKPDPHLTDWVKEVFVRIGPKGLLAELLSSSEEKSSLDQLPRSPSYSGQRLDIASGSIGINEFTRFLADWTGLTVVVDSGISQKQIVVSSSILNADAEIVRAILVSNGCVVEREKLLNGREVVRIRSAKN